MNATDTGTAFEMVVGLEVHVQLKTRTKLFCGCPTAFGAPPNSQVCPVCLGLPGVLPVLNREAFDLALRAALALGAEIAPFTKFDRKNYFYPDLPKNYQISQYDLPFSRGGAVEFESGGAARRIRVHRVHLEEDAGKLLHADAVSADGSLVSAGEGSLVDLNRTGIPLLEIVSEPDIRSAEEAHGYLAALKQILQYSGVSDCDMEKGTLRCDANVSVRPAGETKLGVKVEIKNLNSFRFVAKALEVEARRQIAVLQDGGRIVQETRLWDTERSETRPMRSKEEAHDYRYFPEPDLVPIEVTPAWLAQVRAALPELPRARKERFKKEYGLSEYDADNLTQARETADLFEGTVKTQTQPNPKAISNWILGDLAKESNVRKVHVSELISPKQLGEIVYLTTSGKCTGSAAKAILSFVITSDDKNVSPADVMEKQGLSAVSDAGEIETLCRAAIDANPGPVADFKAGKKSALQFLMGHVMKGSRGKANPKVVQEVLAKLLSP
jgi:aspartyl-tRNA(Asn)/glutamyl-tRNA(Gln) amidotransferase subunit B